MEVDLFFKYPPTATHKTVRECNGGVQVLVTFANGYEASVVRHRYSYGHEDNLWELAVVHNGAIVYNTPVTSDVEGHLTEERVAELLEQIGDLPMHEKL